VLLGCLAQNPFMVSFDEYGPALNGMPVRHSLRQPASRSPTGVTGDYLKVSRDGREINRSLLRTNFVKAAAAMPTEKPSDIKERQGSAYTWAS
jgi:hypothetical protein